MKRRQNETPFAWFRSNRFYKVKDQWFFSTREGIDFGPFDSQELADSALKRYVAEQA